MKRSHGPRKVKSVERQLLPSQRILRFDPTRVGCVRLLADFRLLEFEGKFESLLHFGQFRCREDWYEQQFRDRLPRPTPQILVTQSPRTRLSIRAHNPDHMKFPRRVQCSETGRHPGCAPLCCATLGLVV